MLVFRHREEKPSLRERGLTGEGRGVMARLVGSQWVCSTPLPPVPPPVLPAVIPGLYKKEEDHCEIKGKQATPWKAERRSVPSVLAIPELRQNDISLFCMGHLGHKVAEAVSAAKGSMNVGPNPQAPFIQFPSFWV